VIRLIKAERRIGLSIKLQLFTGTIESRQAVLDSLQARRRSGSPCNHAFDQADEGK